MALVRHDCSQLSDLLELGVVGIHEVDIVCLLAPPGQKMACCVAFMSYCDVALHLARVGGDQYVVKPGIRDEVSGCMSVSRS
jgi:hypothetical protein